MDDQSENAVVAGSDDATEVPDAPTAEVAEALVDAGESIRHIMSDTAQDIVSTLAVLIREKPFVAIGVAAGVAYLLGQLKS